MKPVQRITALLLTLAIAAAGCSTARPPAPAGEQPVPPAPASPPPERTMTVAVYFADWQAQHLIPEPRQVPEAEGAALAGRVVEEILAGPADPHLLRSLPETVRLVEPVTIQNRVAYVNLSPEFLNVRGATGVAMALGSLRLSLTDLPGVDRVQVLVDGKKDVELDEGVLLEPMDRGPVADFPVLFDPERGQYLQSRVDQGLDAWRTDPAAVVRWEGRMFGFTEAELAAAVITPQGTVATAEVGRGEIRYVIELVQQDGAGSNRVWLIRHIARTIDQPTGGPAAGEPDFQPFPAVTVRPIDEAAQDPSLVAFRQELTSVVQRKDLDGLLALMDPNIRVSFGADHGVDELRRMWGLNDNPDQSLLWPLLSDILALGGAFTSDDLKFFAMPYPFVTFPTDMDPFQHTVVTAQNVAVRAEPSLDAPVVERVSHLVLRRLDQGSGTGPTVELDGRTYRWLKVGLPSGETGYIVDRFVWDPVGYRIGFHKQDQGWRITFLVAGD